MASAVQLLKSNQAGDRGSGILLSPLDQRDVTEDGNDLLCFLDASGEGQGNARLDR